MYHFVLKFEEIFSAILGDLAASTHNNSSQAAKSPYIYNSLLLQMFRYTSITKFLSPGKTKPPNLYCDPSTDNSSINYILLFEVLSLI